MEGRHSSPSHAAPTGNTRSGSRTAGSRAGAERGYSSDEYMYESARSPQRTASHERYAYGEEYAPKPRRSTYEEESPARPRRSTYEEQPPVRSRGYEEEYSVRPRRNAEEQSRSRRDYGEEPPARSRGTSRQSASRREENKGFEFGDIIKIILLAGLVLCVFALPHHVIPRLTGGDEEMVPIATAAPTAAAEITPPPPTPGFREETVSEPEPEEPEIIDTRTEWQKKFEDKFTAETVSTAGSYTSPNVSINIETVSGDLNGYMQTYYVADIYVGSIDCFRTYFANNKYTYYGAESAYTISKHAGAILSVNGDYCNNQQSGFLVRNGDVWYNDQSVYDICVLFSDGTMETYAPGSYDPQQLLDMGAWQSWKFGPALLDMNGEVKTSFNAQNVIISEPAPRTGIGYFEPGHYCFIVADGRQAGYARGLVLSEFAQIFKDLGCVRAYNLDGGASAVMSFNGDVCNRQSAPRDLGDIALIAEPVSAEEEAEG